MFACWPTHHGVVAAFKVACVCACVPGSGRYVRGSKRRRRSCISLCLLYMYSAHGKKVHIDRARGYAAFGPIVPTNGRGTGAIIVIRPLCMYTGCRAEGAWAQAGLRLQVCRCIWSRMPAIMSTCTAHARVARLRQGREEKPLYHTAHIHRLRHPGFFRHT